MSTKTITKRVALATVVALGAGVLSLVTVSSASAAVATNNNTAAGSNASAASSAGFLNIGTAKNTTGSAVAPVYNGTDTTSSSVGLVNVSSLGGDLVAGTTQTAVLLSTGKLVVYSTVSTSHKEAIVVTGGTVVGNNAAEGINGSANTVISNGANAGVFAVTITPTSGATSMLVQLYDSGSTAATTSNPTAGTLTGQVLVTIAGSSTAGLVSVAKSSIYYTGATSALTAASDGSNAGSSAYNTVTNAAIAIVDAYGAAIDSATGLTTATATNGALVYVGASTGQTPTLIGSAYSTTTPVNGLTLAVKDPTSAPLNTTVTISYNGTVIGTKTFTFSGDVAKITLSSALNGKIGVSGTTGTAQNKVKVAFADAAGNAVYVGEATYSAWPTSGFQADSATLGSTVTSASLLTAPVNSSTTGYVGFGCGSVAGSGALDVKYINQDGVTVTSNSLTVTCSDVAKTYAAAFDKNSYVPGDVATLTVTFKDSKGNLAADTTDGITNNTDANLPTVNGSQLTPTKALSKTDATTNGVKTYTFIIGTTTGSYNAIVDFPQLDSSSQLAQTVKYTVADGSTSLNDVLKGIVSLIASINKQIAALAKLVTKK